MRASMQKFNELTTSTIDYNKVVREKFAEKEEALAEREAAVCPWFLVITPLSLPSGQNPSRKLTDGYRS